MSYKNTTECLGGVAQPVTASEQSNKYETLCDPRINYLQTKEIISYLSYLVVSTNNSWHANKVLQDNLCLMV